MLNVHDAHGGGGGGKVDERRRKPNDVSHAREH
jgi:hypothetical protein